MYVSGMRTIEFQAEFHHGNVTKKFSCKTKKQMEGRHYDAFKERSCKMDCERNHLRMVSYKRTSGPEIDPFRQLYLKT